MRALVIDGANRFELKQVNAPHVGPNDVLINPIAGGICGTDVEILHGDMFYYTTGIASYPVVPCHEWTGVVSAVGEDVSRICVGDHVVGEVSIGCLRCRSCLTGAYHRCPDRTETGVMNRQGGFAERISLPALFVHKISSSVPVQAAALVEPSAVAFNGVVRAAVSPRDTVAIFGDGPIGLLLLQIVRLFGASRVIVVGAAERRLALAKQLGADATIDARADDVVKDLRAANDGTLPSVVFEASGSPEAVRNALSATAPGGRLILQGFCGARRIDGLNIDPVIVNDLTVMGALGSPGVWPDVIRLIESGRFDPSTIVTDELPLSEFGEAIRRIECREAVKVVLRADLPAAWG